MRRLVNAVFRKAVLSGRVPAPINNVVLAAAAVGARAVGRIAGGVDLLELGSILDAVRYFATYRFDAPSLAGCDKSLASLGNRTHAARTLSFTGSTFEALWVLEGLGYRRAQRALMQNPGDPVDLGVVARLPVRQQGIFHVGGTIMLAQHEFGRSAKNVAADPREAVRSYLRVCDERSSERLRGIEAESLGFVTVTLFPEMLQQIADAVSGEDQRLNAFFWHGVGRGLYLNHPPALGGSGRSWQTLRLSLAAPLDVGLETSVLEGYGWALGLVNLRQPFVVRGRTDTFATPGGETDALRCGLRDALSCWLRWQGWDGDAGSIDALTPTAPREVEGWCDLVSIVLGQPDTNAVSLSGRTYGEMLVPADSTGELK